MKQSTLLWLSLHILKTDKSCNIMKNMLNTNLWWSGRNSRRKYLSSLVYSLNPKQNWSESIFRQLRPPPASPKKIHIPYTVYFLLSVYSIIIKSIQVQLHFFMWTELSIILFMHILLCSWVQRTFNYWKHIPLCNTCTSLRKEKTCRDILQWLLRILFLSCSARYNLLYTVIACALNIPTQL